MVTRSLTLPMSLCLTCLILMGGNFAHAQEKAQRVKVALLTDPQPGLAAQHGLKQLKEALRAKNVIIQDEKKAADADMVILAGLGTGNGVRATFLKSLDIAPPDGPESIVVHHATAKDKKFLLISGGDDVGLMYALLDVADRIGWAEAKDPFAQVKDTSEKPAVKERILSMYAMQQAYFEQRLFDAQYWDKYFSMLARNRFNHYLMIFGYENAGFLAPPYPYFCDVDGYPDVKMVGLSKEQQKKNLDALNRVIRQAHDHGIKFSVGIWDHIYRGGVQTGGAKESKAGREGTVVGVTEKNLMKYTPVAFATLMKKLPELDGVQFRMHDESGLKNGAKLQQFWTSMFNSLKGTDRKLRFELRAKGMPDEVIDLAVDSGIDFRLSTRFWTEQMGLPFHPTHINKQNQFDRRHSYADLLKYPQRYAINWQLWTGGTTRILLWGDPEYSRRFMESTHLYNGEGFTVYEPLTTKMASHPHTQKPVEILNPQYRYYDYEFERYWHWFQCFGRIGYNPDTPPEVWKKEFERRFGKEAAPHVEAALHKASQILPRINATVFPYKNFPTTYGWAEKQRRGDLPDYAKAEVSDTQQFLTMDEAAKLIIEGGESAKVWPDDNFFLFYVASSEVRQHVASAQAKIGKHKSKEFISTTTDLQILASLATFHANRIKAGVHYALFKRSNDVSELDEAIAFETLAIDRWSDLVKVAGDVYASDLMMGRPDAGLSGHWKDELAALLTGFEALTKERNDFKPMAGIAHVPVRKLGPVRHTPLTIRAAISGFGPKSAVRVMFRTGTGEWKHVEMQSRGKDVYRVTLQDKDITNDVEYFIEVIDAGKSTTFPPQGKNRPLTIAVTTHFALTDDITHIPITIAQPGKPLSIKAKITDPSGVKWARVLYRNVNQKEDFKILPMKLIDGKDQYEAIIPGDAITPQYDIMYLIEVMDTKGNGRIYPDLEKETPYVIVRVQRP